MEMGSWPHPENVQFSIVVETFTAPWFGIPFVKAAASNMAIHSLPPAPQKLQSLNEQFFMVTFSVRQPSYQ